MKKYSNWILSHEHLSIDFSAIKGDLDTKYRDEEQIIEEFKDLKKNGLFAVVDVSTFGMKINDTFFPKFENETGVKVIRSTGFYKEPFIEEKYSKMSVEELIDVLEKTISDKNVIGEIGTSKDKMTDLEKKVFEASIVVSNRHNVSIYTHTTLGTYALEQANFIMEKGANPKKVIIGHQDLNQNIDEVIEIAKKGFNIGIDTIGKNNYNSDENRIKLINRLIEEELYDNIVFSMDITRKSNLKNHGGKGYLNTFREFIEKLEKIIPKNMIEKFIIDNPRRIFNI